MRSLKIINFSSIIFNFLLFIFLHIFFIKILFFFDIFFLWGPCIPLYYFNLFKFCDIAVFNSINNKVNYLIINHFNKSTLCLNGYFQHMIEDQNKHLFIQTIQTKVYKQCLKLTIKHEIILELLFCYHFWTIAWYFNFYEFTH